MNKSTILFCLIVSLFVTRSLSGKDFRMWGNPYVGIESYDGITTNGYYTLVISEVWGTELYAENWKISVRLTGDIVSQDGTKIFPSNKVGFIPSNIIGQPSPVPTVQQIGMPSPVFLNGTNEVFLVPCSNVPLNNKQENVYLYFQLEMNFQLTAIGGGYLDVLDDDTGNTTITYSAPFEFKAYIGNEVFTINQTYSILQVHKLSTGCTDYAILVSPEASNALLEFNSIADYTNGKSITCSNGLTVFSNVAYQLRVSSIYPDFSAGNGDTLPLDVLRVQITGATQCSNPEPLSSSMVTLLGDTPTGNSSRSYNIIYSTVANDCRLFGTPSEQYSADLIFEITPQ